VVVAVNITVDTDGIVSTDGRGWRAGQAPRSGIGQIKHRLGSAGASHGGLGGRGGHVAYAGLAYGSVHRPVHYGSGGGVGTGITDTGGQGGGIIRMQASQVMEVDGRVSADGATANTPGVGGGAGGSVWLMAAHFLGNNLNTSDLYRKLSLYLTVIWHHTSCGI
jgi:hypothetical protein